MRGAETYRQTEVEVGDRRHPYDAMAYSDSDMTKIKAAVPPPHEDKPAILYTAYVYQPGTQQQAEMKKKLDLLLENTHVLEQ